MTYGIIGSTGHIGRHVSEILEKKGYRILKAGRSLKNSDKERQLDINDKENLRQFISECNLVINCAGPSTFISEKILTECILLGKNYIDAFGWIEDIDRRDYKDSVIVLNAGTVPGLPGILAKYLSKEDSGKLMVCSGGIEMAGKSSLIDMIVSSFNGYSSPGMEIREGKPEKVSYQVNASFLNMPGILQPLITAEIRDISNILGYKNICNYNIWPDESLKNLMIEGCMLYASAKEEEDKNTAIEKIYRKLSEAVTVKKSWYRLLVKAEYKTESQVVDIRTKDSSVLTALVICHIAERLGKNNKLRPAYYRPFELADTGKLLEEISNYDIDISIYGEI